MRDRTYRRLWSSLLLSSFGGQLTLLALPLSILAAVIGLFYTGDTINAMTLGGLALAVLLIVGNTIRLSIINRRTEIEINKLFGATNAFIQRPFLYSGLLYGVAGSLLAWLLLLASTAVMTGPVRDLAALYDSGFMLESLSATEILVLVATGGGLGLLGSWIAVARHLRAAEPV